LIINKNYLELQMNTKVLKKRILVTGAGGFVGFSLMDKIAALSPIGVTYKPKKNLSNLISLDLRGEENVKEVINYYKPRAIIHLAALTNPEVNENNKELAKESNLGITRNIVKNLPKDCHLIYHSTDKIWNGSNSFPDEETEPNPDTYHGELKVQCENLIKQNLEKYHILRLSVIHSFSYKEPISSLAGPGQFIEKTLDKLSRGEKAEVFSNIKRCFTKKEELVDLHLQILDDTNFGIYNVGSPMKSYLKRIEQLSKELPIKLNDNLIAGKGKVEPIEQNLNTAKVEKTFNIKFT